MGCSSAVCSLYDETITVTQLVVDECDNHAKALLVEFASSVFANLNSNREISRQSFFIVMSGQI